MQTSQPRRLHRTRRRHNYTPVGAEYVGRPSLCSNPFERRQGISQARSVILYKAWIAGEVTRRMLIGLGFGYDEIVALDRWRRHLIARIIPDLEGKDLQCWCPLTSDWCHADVLLRLANRPQRLAA